MSLVLSASTEAELVTITRDYLATWSPQEIFRLPRECRPGRRIRDGVDIGSLAFALARTHCFHTGTARDIALLEKMMVFFTHAATRVAQLQAEAPRGTDND